MNIRFISTIATIGCILVFNSCATVGGFKPGKGNKYQYTYKLIYPAESQEMLYQDDSIIVQFKFDEAAIRFQLQNISDSYLEIRWDKAAIGVGGRFSPVRNSFNLYSDTAVQNSILLPSLGYIRDVAIPRDNIYFNGEDWIEVDLLPTEDHNSEQMREVILKNVGQRINFTLPMMFGSSEKIYEFEFQVDSVRQIPWRDYRHLPRIPQPPSPKRTFFGISDVSAAIITAGILGFSAYVLTMKKNPPTE